MTHALALALALASPVHAQARVQVSYEIIVAQVGKRDETWQDLSRKFQALDGDQAEAMQAALARDNVRVVSRPMLTALSTQEAFVEQRSGDEFLRATLSSVPTMDGYDVDATLELDVVKGPITWDAVVPVAEDDLAVLAVRPKKNLVVLIRMRRSGAR
ncbi:hypothetical protein L6R53_08325 [Myxococcota bacterium]|nr:hypothetical protein [Myxococcota bacterium]